MTGDEAAGGDAAGGGESAWATGGPSDAASRDSREVRASQKGPHVLAVEKLPAECTEEEVYRLFHAFGTVSGLTLSDPRAGSGTFQRSAVVAYESRRSGDDAIMLLDGRYSMRPEVREPIEIRWATPHVAADREEPYMWHTLNVDRLPSDCTEYHVRAVFETYGKVLHVQMVPSDTRHGLLAALVDFELEQAGEDAIQVLHDHYKIREELEEPLSVVWADGRCLSRSSSSAELEAAADRVVVGTRERRRASVSKVLDQRRLSATEAVLFLKKAFDEAPPRAAGSGAAAVAALAATASPPSEAEAEAAADAEAATMKLPAAVEAPTLKLPAAADEAVPGLAEGAVAAGVLAATVKQPPADADDPAAAASRPPHSLPPLAAMPPVADRPSAAGVGEWPVEAASVAAPPPPPGPAAPALEAAADLATPPPLPPPSAPAAEEPLSLQQPRRPASASLRRPVGVQQVAAPPAPISGVPPPAASHQSGPALGSAPSPATPAASRLQREVVAVPAPDYGSQGPQSAPVSPVRHIEGELLEAVTSSLKVSRVARRHEVQVESEEVIVVPVIQEVEKVVEVEVEVIQEKPRYVPSGKQVIQRIEQVEEVEGPVVYVDRIVEVPMDQVVDEPCVVEVEQILARTYEVVHHIPRFVSVPQVVKRLVQRPVDKVVEKAVQIKRVVPKEVVTWEEVELVREIPIIVEEEVRVSLKVQQPHVTVRPVPVEVPRQRVEERVIEQVVDVKEEVVQEMALSEAASQVHIVQEQDRQVPVFMPKPRYVEVPEIRYVERRVERPVVRCVLVDVPRDETCIEVVKRRLEVPRVEYRDKVVPVPRLKRQEHTVEVPRETRMLETHHISGRQTEPALIKYLERFIDVPQVRTEHIDITVGSLLVTDVVADVEIVHEVLKYEEVVEELEIPVRRQRPKYVDVERVFKVPKYIFEEVHEDVALWEEHAEVTEREELLEVTRLHQRARLVQEVTEVVVGRKAGRLPQCLHCLRNMELLAGSSRRGLPFKCAACGRVDCKGPRWHCSCCLLDLCAAACGTGSRTQASSAAAGAAAAAAPP